MAAIPVQDVAGTGNANVTFAAANSGGDTVAGGTRSTGGWEEHMIVLITINGAAVTQTVTVGGNAVPILAGDTAVIPVHSEGVGDVSVAVTYSAVASLTVAAVKIGA